MVVIFTTMPQISIKDSHLDVAADLRTNATFHSFDDTLRAPIHVDVSSLSAAPKILYCIQGDGNGMIELKATISAILPEFVFEDLSSLDRSKLQTKPSNEYDVFIGLLRLGCPSDALDWILLSFRGHIILNSPESPKEHPDKSMLRQNIHYFGPVIDPRENDWVLTYLQTTWWQSFQSELPPEAIVRGDLRPRRPDDWDQELFFMVYAHGNCVEIREVAAWRFSKVGEVHCCGKCCGKALDGNRTNLIPRKAGGLRSWRSNVDLYRNYRFCLVMEHEMDHKSYLTEKLLMAFIAGCIPVFHGPADLVFDMFNPQAFVFYNISDPQPALNQVEALLHDENSYHQMLHQPIAAKGNSTLEEYFSFADDIGNGALKRKIRHKLGLSGISFDRP